MVADRAVAVKRALAPFACGACVAIALVSGCSAEPSLVGKYKFVGGRADATLEMRPDKK